LNGELMVRIDLEIFEHANSPGWWAQVPSLGTPRRNPNLQPSQTCSINSVPSIPSSTTPQTFYLSLSQHSKVQRSTVHSKSQHERARRRRRERGRRRPPAGRWPRRERGQGEWDWHRRSGREGWQGRARRRWRDGWGRRQRRPQLRRRRR
jgi:hypothetical protein